MPDTWREMPVCKETGPAVPFLECAAGECFWSVPISSTKRLGKEQYKLTLSGTDVDMLSSISVHILKCDDLQLAKILEKRCAGHDKLKSDVCAARGVCKTLGVFGLDVLCLEVSQPP